MRKAIAKIEFEADDYVWDKITYVTKNGIDHDHTIFSALEERLKRLFRRQIQESGDVFSEILNSSQSTIEANHISDIVMDDHSNLQHLKEYWLPIYRVTLKKAIGLLGNPYRVRNLGIEKTIL